MRQLEQPYNYSTLVGSLSDFVQFTNEEDIAPQQKLPMESESPKKMELGYLKLFSVDEDTLDQLPDDGAHADEVGSVSSQVSVNTKCCRFTKDTKSKIDRIFPAKAPWDNSSEEEGDELKEDKEDEEELNGEYVAIEGIQSQNKKDNKPEGSEKKFDVKLEFKEDKLEEIETSDNKEAIYRLKFTSTRRLIEERCVNTSQFTYSSNLIFNKLIKK